MIDSFQNLLPAIIFWISFSFTPGPFWLIWMNYHTQNNTLHIYKAYILHILTCLFPLSMGLSYLVHSSIAWNKNILLPLYFIGGAVIVYLGIKAIYAKVKNIKIELNYLKIVMISATNPKLYLTVPAGSLSIINFSNSTILNTFVFSFIVMIPIILSGSLFFYFLAKLSLRTSYTSVIKNITNSIMVGYGIYLIVQGIILAQSL